MHDLLIDFSALSTLVCGRRYQLTCVRGFDSSSPDTNFGSAFHRFAELRGKGDKTPVIELCTQISAEFSVEPGKLLMLCAQFDSKFKFPEILTDKDGKPLVEWKFAQRIGTLRGYNIVLCGTVDLLSMNKSNLVITDYKTTAATGNAAERIVGEYVTSFQLPFYIFMLHKYLWQYLPEPLSGAASSLSIAGQYLMAYHSLTPAKFEYTAPITLHANALHSYEELLFNLINKAIDIHERAALYPPEGMMYKVCPKCPFNHLCIMKDEERLLNVLNTYPTKQYDPTNFR